MRNINWLQEAAECWEIFKFIIHLKLLELPSTKTWTIDCKSMKTSFLLVGTQFCHILHNQVPHISCILINWPHEHRTELPSCVWWHDWPNNHHYIIIIIICYWNLNACSSFLSNLRLREFGKVTKALGLRLESLQLLLDFDKVVSCN